MRAHPMPALFTAMDQVLDTQTEKLAIPRRLTADMKELWALQWRLEQRSGRKPFRVLEHPRFRAAYDFLVLRGASGEAPQALVDWWTRFQDATPEEREAMLKPDEAPKKRRRSRRGRKRRAEASTAGESTAPPAAGDE